MSQPKPQEESDHESTPLLLHDKPNISYTTQVLSSFIASLGSFNLGALLGWASPAHPDLKARGSLGPITDYDLTWVSVSCMVGMIVGSLAVGLNVEKYGSRSTMLILCVPSIVGWVLMAIPLNLVGLGFGRFIGGFSEGGLCVLAPLYISEISDPEIRGRLTTLGNSMLSLGILYVYVVGWLVPWGWLSAACGAVCLLFLCAAYFYLRDSPYYLLERERFEDGRIVVRWLSGDAVSQNYIDQRLQEVKLAVQQHTSGGMLNDAMLRKPFAICVGLFACQQLCGANVVVFYAVGIFTSTGSWLSPNLAAILVASSQVLFIASSSLVVDKIGRRIPMVLSQAGMGAALSALGTFIYFDEDYSWVPESCVVVFMIMYSLGACSVPWLMLAELCGNQVVVMCSVVSAFCWFLALIVVGSFSPLVDAVGAYSVFWGYGALSFLGCLFCALLLPETKGMSLLQLRNHQCFPQ